MFRWLRAFGGIFSVGGGICIDLCPQLYSDAPNLGKASLDVKLQQNPSIVKVFGLFEIAKDWKMAGVTGLEPAASCVTGRRSNQLSYTPAKRSFLIRHVSARPSSPVGLCRTLTFPTRRLSAGKSGGGDRSRTRDILNANQVLYQLSYAPTGRN